MSIFNSFKKMGKGGQAVKGFLSPLTNKEKVAVSNLNPLIYDAVIKEKSGQGPQVIVEGGADKLLKKLEVDDIRRLKESVELGKKGQACRNMTEAAEYFGKAIEVNPYADLALMSYGCAIANTGRLREGIKWVEKAVAVNPDNVQARQNLQAMKASLK